MMGGAHRLAGAVTWLAVAPLMGVHGPAWLVGAGIAGMFSHGELSPDMDQRGLLAKVIPGGHRGCTHTPLLPIVAWFASLRIGPELYRWAVWAVIVAWASHIATDAVFGRVPILPRPGGGWWRVGLGLRTGGWVERWVAVPAFCVIGFAAVTGLR